jgi:hypothetical protein
MEEEKVKMEDRDPEIHEFMILLRMAGFNISYQSTDVVWDLFKKYRSSGGEIDIKDIVKFSNEKEEKWNNYFKKQQEQ